MGRGVTYGVRFTFRSEDEKEGFKSFVEDWKEEDLQKRKSRFKLAKKNENNTSTTSTIERSDNSGIKRSDSKNNNTIELWLGKDIKASSLMQTKPKPTATFGFLYSLQNEKGKPVAPLRTSPRESLRSIFFLKRVNTFSKNKLQTKSKTMLTFFNFCEIRFFSFCEIAKRKKENPIFAKLQNAKRKSVEHIFKK